MSARGHPWYRTSHRCWYVWHEGAQVRLHPEEGEALRLWHLLEVGLWSPDGSGPTLAEVIGEYLKFSASRHRPATTEMKAKRLVPLRDAMPLLAAAAFDGARADEFLSGKPSWGATVRSMFCTAAKGCLRWAMSRRMIGAFPLEGWSVPRSKSRRPDAVVSLETHQALLAVAQPWLRDLLTALRETGCRPSEAYSVTAADHRAGCWVLSQHKTSHATDAPRVIHLNAKADALTSRLSERRPAGPLFRGADGGAAVGERVCVRLWRLCRKHGLPHVFPYAYRHTYATDLLTAGVPDATVAELLGHAGTRVLHQHYSHLCARQRHLRESLQKARG